MKTVAVIGGGPAGLMAAQVLAEGGCAVTVYDRMPSVGRKLLMAGRGGLNLTHSEPLERFLPRYGPAVERLTPMIEAFTPQALIDWQNDTKPRGEVYLVGAGPGDPDLLTFKALRLMQQADVVVYDRLVSAPIMELVRRDAERIYVGKARADHAVPQEDINHMLVRLAQEGKRVCRLKGGDPFIFGRGGEEIEQLVAADVAFQVVPGITAASGCSAYAGIPLTHRDHAQSVRFLTGHQKAGSPELPWSELIYEHQTLVLYMGLVGLRTICAQLIAHGLRADMPVALISKGTTPEQKVVVGTVATIADQIEHEHIPAPTLTIIGEVVKLRDKLRWFD